MGTLQIRVGEHQRALWYRDGKLAAIRGPGVYWSVRQWLRPATERVVILDTLQARVPDEHVEHVSRHASSGEHVHTCVLGETQRALVWRDGKLLTALGPGRHAFWKSPATIEIETFDTAQRRLQHPKLEAIAAHADARPWIEVYNAADTDATVLYLNLVLSERLAPGKHVFWRGQGQLATRTVDLREQTTEVAGQEIMTSDKVTLRITLLLTFRVVDAIKLLTSIADFPNTLYREAQLALRAAVGTRTLDQLLADKDSVGNEVARAVVGRGEEIGVAVRAVGIRDIILPGEMKTILNQVIEAEKRAQAEGIRRREETASARSQANTAKLLAENPVMARFRELEMIQELVKGANVTFVLGNADVAEQMRSLVGSAPKN